MYTEPITLPDEYWEGARDWDDGTYVCWKWMKPVDETNEYFT